MSDEKERVGRVMAKEGSVSLEFTNISLCSAPGVRAEGMRGFRRGASGLHHFLVPGKLQEATGL